MKITGFLLCLGLLATDVMIQPLVAAEDKKGSEALATTLTQLDSIRYAAVSEPSGIVKSRRFADTYWVHNDSGDRARLFAIDGDGNIIFPPFLKREFHGEVAEEGKQPWPGHEVFVAANIDWEDIATDGEMLYVAETGNNGNARRDLGIYAIPEPNPRAVEATRPIAFYPVRYPGQQQFPARQWHFDGESLFVFRDKLYLISKHRKPGKISEFETGARLYRLDTRYTDRFNELTMIDEFDGLAIATAAELSPDSSRLAVLSYTDLWLFDAPRRGDKWFSGNKYRLPLSRMQMKTNEAVTWADGETLLIVNEEGDRFTVRADDIPVYDQ
ncbi:MAG: hypothetical protein KDI36_07420 [Pseudomonadales bacterium]|nr:hypothetical protein [Pseudomonadales bacterium]